MSVNVWGLGGLHNDMGQGVSIVGVVICGLCFLGVSTGIEVNVV